MGGIDSLDFERADRRTGKFTHRQNGEFRSATKTNRSGFLDAPNYQLDSAAYFSVQPPSAICSAFSLCISQVGSYFENVWIEQ
jgi:hypothetical protein